MQNAIINAGTHPFTVKSPELNPLASLIIIADTKTFIKKVISPSVRISNGRRIA